MFVRCGNCGERVRLREGEVLLGCEKPEGQHVIEGCDGESFRVKEESS